MATASSPLKISERWYPSHLDSVFDQVGVVVLCGAPALFSVLFDKSIPSLGISILIVLAAVLINGGIFSMYISPNEEKEVLEVQEAALLLMATGSVLAVLIQLIAGPEPHVAIRLIDVFIRFAGVSVCTILLVEAGHSKL